MKFFCAAAFVFFISREDASAQHIFVAGNDTINQIDTNGLKQGYWIDYGNNQINKSYSPGSIVSEGYYVDNKKTGKWVEYWPDGHKKTELNYINNRPDGVATSYFENGHMRETGTWKKNGWTGTYRSYYDNDTLREQIFFDQNGRHDSTSLYFYPNGKLKLSIEYSNGKENGWKREYTESGNLFSESWFCGGIEDLSKHKEHASETLSLKPALKDSLTATVPAPSTIDTTIIIGIPANPEEEHSRINEACRLVSCNCETGTCPDQKCSHDGMYCLFDNGKIAQKGCFSQFRLMCGVKCMYDDKGRLIQISEYKCGICCRVILFTAEQ